MCSALSSLTRSIAVIVFYKLKPRTVTYSIEPLCMPQHRLAQAYGVAIAYVIDPALHAGRDLCQG